MSNFKSSIFYFLLLLLSSISIAQQYNFTHLSTNKGLPSSECYGLIQDSKGYMWIRTLNGLCKYDGNHIKIFTKKEGLKTNATYALYEDKKGRIWFSNSSSHIGYILNDVVCYLKCSEKLAKENGFGQKIFYKIMLDKNENVYIASHERSYIIYSKNDFVNYKLIPQNEYTLKFEKIDNQIFCIPDTTSKVQPLSQINFTLSAFGKEFNIDWQLQTIKQGVIRITYPCVDTSGTLFFNLNQRLFYLEKNGEFKSLNFDNLVYHIFIDKNNNLWLGLNGGGLLFYSNCDLTKEPRRFLEKESISGIVQDFEGGIWASSLNNGIFYCKNLYNENLISSNLFNFKPEMLNTIDSNLFLSDINNNLIVYNLINKHTVKKKIKYGYTGIIDIDKTPNGYILSGRNRLSIFNNDFEFKNWIFSNKKYKLSSGSYNTIVTENNEVWGISKNDIINYNTGISYKINSFGNDILSFKNVIYVATKNELLLFNSFEPVQFSTLITGENILKLLLFNDKIIALCKDGKVYTIINNEVSKILDVPNASFSDACIADSNKFLIATNQGIFILNLLNNKFSIVNTSEGILDNEVFKITSYQNKAYYSTIYGIGIVEINKLGKNIYAPKIIASYLHVDNNKTFKNYEKYNYNSSINLKFDVISFKDNEHLKIFYYLEGFDHQWRSNGNGEINYINLPNGNYTLKVYGENSNGHKSNILSYNFTIDLPFFKTWWFILTSILFIVFIGYLVYRISYYYINKREVNKTKINKMLAEYQLMGLKAQMNPHFIFNCLNSIQKYVLEHDSKQAYTYMAKFSKLIRFVLDISDKTFVALSDEIDLVKLYVELEQLRFDKKFEFCVDIHDNVKIDDVMIPSLLIQPYLENAIWHGIMNLDQNQKGEIKISVVAYKNDIIITISDNGVGREKAKMLSLNSHQSKGLSINEKRIEAINYLLKSRNATIEIIDLYAENNQPKGTKVIIKLPLKYDE